VRRKWTVSRIRGRKVTSEVKKISNVGKSSIKGEKFGKLVSDVK